MATTETGTHETATDQTERLSELKIDRSLVGGRKRSWRWIALGVLVLVVVVAVVVMLRRPASVEVAQVREARVGEQQTELTAAGYVSSRRRSVVAPKVPGRLEKLLVEEGEAVEEGQLLAQLDARDARVALQRARAEATAARAALAGLRAEEERSRREEARAQKLAEGGVIAREDFDRTQTLTKTVRSQREAAEAQLRAAGELVHAAELDVDSTQVKAPFAGTVVRKLADEGAVLAPAAISTENVGGIVELVDLSQLEVEAEVAEDDLARLKAGQPVLIELDAFPEKQWRGEITSFRPAIDRSKGTGVVKVAFAEEPERVLPDMSARVSFLAKPLPEAALAEGPRLRVPSSAIVEHEGKPVVLGVKEGRIEAIPIEPGEVIGEERVLEAGPPPGTQIVQRPRKGLAPGDRVRVEVSGS